MSFETLFMVRQEQIHNIIADNTDEIILMQILVAREKVATWI